jgi:hypothetical protein
MLLTPPKSERIAEEITQLYQREIKIIQGS